MKVFAKDEWYISLSDFWSEIKKAKFKIVFVALLMGALFFVRQLLLPTMYQAEGILVSSNTNSKNNNVLFQAFQISIPNALNDDVFTFLDSIEVMKRVVEKLNLQAFVIEPSSTNRFKQIGNNLKIEGYYHYYKKLSRPASQILTDDVIVADNDFFPKKPSTLSCHNVFYDAAFSSKLEIIFIDDTSFEVIALGQGKLDEPFYFENGAFTLHLNKKTPLAKQKFHLSFIPLEAAAKSLKKTIKIVPDTKKTNLTHIYFNHPDKVLATSVVNELMACYQEFVINMAEEKIQRQLNYLEKRKKETEASLEKTGLMSLCCEMKKIASINSPHEITISDLLNEVRKSKDDATLKADMQSLSFEVALEQLQENQIEYGHIEQKEKKYGLCLQKLNLPDFDVVEMVSILKGTEAAGHLNEIENLNYIINDRKSYTPKEIEFTEQRIETKKQYLISFLTQLIKACEIEKKILCEKIERIKKIALLFLLDEYDLIANQIKDFDVKNSIGANKWSYEKKTEFQEELYADTLKMLSDNIESKNLSLHLHSLDSYPFQKANVPLLPIKPKLTLKFFFGLFFGTFLYIFVLFIKTIYVGALATRANLKGAGYTVLDKISKEDQVLQKLSFFLCDKRKGILLLSSEIQFYPLNCILEILNIQQSSFLIIDFASKESQGLQNYLDGKIEQLPIDGNTLVFGHTAKFIEHYLKSKKFEDLLNVFKTKYDWIIFVNRENTQSFETQILTDIANYVIYLATNEKLTTFSHLPKEKLYFLIERRQKEKELKKAFSFLKKQKQKSLKAIEPSVQALMQEVQGNRPLSFLFSLWSRARTRL